MPTGMHVPGEVTPTNAIAPSAGARRLLDALDAAPTKPMRGPELKPPPALPPTTNPADRQAKLRQLEADEKNPPAEA
jgi:hypothetical protein